jgi:hypothetical protein
MVKKIKMIITYYPNSKNTHNLDSWNLKFLEIQNMFQNFKISKFTTCKWVVMCITYFLIVIYDKEKA